MTLMGFLLLLLIGAICGGLAQAIVGFSVGGFLVSAGIGFVGALIGGWLGVTLHLPTLFAVTIDGRSIEIFWTVLGSILLVLVVSLFRRRPRYDRRFTA